MRSFPHCCQLREGRGSLILQCLLSVTIQTEEDSALGQARPQAPPESSLGRFRIWIIFRDFSSPQNAHQPFSTIRVREAHLEEQ